MAQLWCVKHANCWPNTRTERKGSHAGMSNTQPEPNIPSKSLGPIGVFLYKCANAFALLGGLILSGLVVMVVLSVLGRWLFSSPIFGDFEMVALGTAISVFLFLPYCQMNRGNIIVDVFLSWAPKQVQTLLDVAGSIALALIAALLAWRMTMGGIDAVNYNELTYILALPIWWAYPFAVASLILLALISLYMAFLDALRAFK